jgi:uncharacterized membrane protein
MAPTVELLTLGVHVAFGFAALGAGAGAVLTEKGGRAHRRFGRGYVYSMTVVAATALALYPIEPTANRLFLALVAVFSYYFVFSGYRVLGRKRPSARPAAVDWLAVGALTVTGVGLLAYGGFVTAQGGRVAPVMLVFGGIAAVFGVVDLRAFRDPEVTDRHWALAHLTRMGGGYIATVTAFATVNFTFVPSIVRWLGPTVVGSAAIAYGVRRYRPRFDPAARRAD